MKKIKEKLLIGAILLVICMTIVIILLILSINKTLHEDDAILQNNKDRKSVV